MNHRQKRNEQSELSI